ncbi:F-box domain containing protein [Melia azedarach]|uniref:F-box domain containing protein n=1 Tax=Melia azedarach TaxID=155640 RepID=A0ACC1YI35_MELAZ|nr:F-box domain containing protein [Melia azedarach]
MELKELEELNDYVFSEEEEEVAAEVNKRGKKRKRNGRRKKRERDKITKQEEVVVLQDPLEVFGGDIMLLILGKLDARSVALSLLVSRAWHGVASSDSLWTSKCEELWLGKAHVPRLALVPGLPKLAAYSLSVMDGKRNRIMKEDLCDHVWEFHFNKVVPEYWRNLDPYWKGTSPLMHRYFHMDGSQTADPGDKEAGLELGNVQHPLLLLQCS